VRANEPRSAYDEFAGRARRYCCLDERFLHRTRFFAAAALTNTVLAELCAHRARWLCVSPKTIGALAWLGGRLEAVNVDRASCLDREGGAPRWVDISFIEMEQTVVEAVLRGWAEACSPRYRHLINEVDGLLRAVSSGLLPLRCSGNVHRYTQVLRSVATTAGRCPSFAVREDRINIGKALIAQVRRAASE